MSSRPNVVFVFADQLRLQSLGYAGDPNAISPRIDALAAESVNFMTAVSGCPVCSPARASLLTGQYPDRHGVFVNDVYLGESQTGMGNIFKDSDYATAYIGKWHLDGHGERHGVIPPERRQGFDYWMTMECTHSYMKSPFYDNNDTDIKFWDGYDAISQTEDACSYIKNHSGEKPFCLVLSWGPPHTPCGPPWIPGPNVPQEYLDLFDRDALELRGNVDPECEERARDDLTAYYAHIKALDDCTGMLLDTLDEKKIADDTIFVLWSDHGDMLGSQGEWKKQRPWDESILVPLMIRYPNEFGTTGRTITAPINTPDLLPTLLSLCDIAIPDTVDGLDYLPFLRNRGEAPSDGALVACYQPFGQFPRHQGGMEYRGLRTERHTYVRTLDGPWLLYDNQDDPLQLNNMTSQDSASDLQRELDQKLDGLLARYHDDFKNGEDYMTRWGYEHDASGTPKYTWVLPPEKTT